MRGRLQWAWSATSRAAREHLWWNVVFAVVILAVAEVLWLRRHATWTHALLVNASEGLGLAVAASFVIAAILFLWNIARARDKMLINRLRPGPEAVAGEQARIRELRAWIGMLAQEVGDTRAHLERMRAAGHYWDPYRQSFELTRFAESSGLLATDPRTQPAFHALDALRQEMDTLTHVVRDRWNDDMQFEIINPNDVVDEPEVREDDDLDRLDAAIETAARELTNATRQLGR